MRKLTILQKSYDLLNPFKIAHGTRTKSDVIQVEIEENGFKGVAESVPYKRYDETCESVIKQIEEIRSAVENGIDNFDLQKIIKAGAARNAVDCAIWDLKAKQNGKKIWEILNLPKPEIVETAYTLVIDKPEIMALQAIEKKNFPILKMKLAGDGQDEDRICAVRNARKDAKIVLDANESWDAEIYQKLIEICQKNEIFMIEQPFKAKNDDFLSKIERKITICADESCHVVRDLEKLKGKYDMINIKLDKAGGLTESLILMKKARDLGFQIMVGCMVGSSLAVLPAFYLAQLADFVDIDCPLLLKNDLDLLNFDGNKVSEG